MIAFTDKEPKVHTFKSLLRAAGHILTAVLNAGFHGTKPLGNHRQARRSICTSTIEWLLLRNVASFPGRIFFLLVYSIGVQSELGEEWVARLALYPDLATFWLVSRDITVLGFLLREKYIGNLCTEGDVDAVPISNRNDGSNPTKIDTFQGQGIAALAVFASASNGHSCKVPLTDADQAKYAGTYRTIDLCA